MAEEKWYNFVAAIEELAEVSGKGKERKKESRPCRARDSK